MHLYLYSVFLFFLLLLWSLYQLNIYYSPFFLEISSSDIFFVNILQHVSLSFHWSKLPKSLRGIEIQSSWVTRWFFLSFFDNTWWLIQLELQLNWVNLAEMRWALHIFSTDSITWLTWDEKYIKHFPYGFGICTCSNMLFDNFDMSVHLQNICPFALWIFFRQKILPVLYWEKNSLYTIWYLSQNLDFRLRPP